MPQRPCSPPGSGSGGDSPGASEGGGRAPTRGGREAVLLTHLGLVGAHGATFGNQSCYLTAVRHASVGALAVLAEIVRHPLAPLGELAPKAPLVVELTVGRTARPRAPPLPSRARAQALLAGRHSRCSGAPRRARCSARPPRPPRPPRPSGRRRALGAPRRPSSAPSPPGLRWSRGRAAEVPGCAPAVHPRPGRPPGPARPAPGWVRVRRVSTLPPAHRPAPSP